jgi:hypothetical protein
MEYSGQGRIRASTWARVTRSWAGVHRLATTHTHLPAAGEIVLFDRSWYNRAGVERAGPGPGTHAGPIGDPPGPASRLFEDGDDARDPHQRL